jgi:hypothetical protein
MGSSDKSFGLSCIIFCVNNFLELYPLMKLKFYPMRVEDALHEFKIKPIDMNRSCLERVSIFIIIIIIIF